VASLERAQVTVDTDGTTVLCEQDKKCKQSSVHELRKKHSVFVHTPRRYCIKEWMLR
jgi:hypothetical protein